jgi:hypothetical protein
MRRVIDRLIAALLDDMADMRVAMSEIATELDRPHFA